MEAIILDKPGQLRLLQMEEPSEPSPGQALVRVRRIGVCGTDFHAFRGEQPFFTYPRILGHELGVEVVAAGPGEQDLSAGARCALEPYFNCGRCPACRRGKPNCCVNLEVFGVHAHGGRLIFVGFVQGDVTFHDPEFHRRELTLLSSRNATATDFRRIIGFLEEGKIDLTPWITHRASSDSMSDMFPGWFERESGTI